MDKKGRCLSERVCGCVCVCIRARASRRRERHSREGELLSLHPGKHQYTGWELPLLCRVLSSAGGLFPEKFRSTIAVLSVFASCLYCSVALSLPIFPPSVSCGVLVLETRESYGELGSLELWELGESCTEKPTSVIALPFFAS
jgi:hypothetical protein